MPNQRYRLVPLGSSGVSVYYVATTGDDTTGNGSAAAPWKTINKALSTIPLTGFADIIVAAGTYTEDTGGLKYLLVNQVFAQRVTVRAATGATVTLKDKASGTYCLYLQDCANVNFDHIIIEQAGSNTNATVVVAGNVSAGFANCTINTRNYGIRGNTLAGTVSLTLSDTIIHKRSDVTTADIFPVNLSTAAGGVLSLTMTNCTCAGQKASYGLPACVNAGQEDASSSVSVVIDGGTFTGTAHASVHVDGGSLVIHNASLTSTLAPPLIAGDDGASVYTTTGEIIGCVLTSGTSHGILIGKGTSGMLITNCQLYPGDYGIVIKGVGIIVDGCELMTPAGYTAACFKSSTNCTIKNTILRSAGIHGCLSFEVQIAGNTGMIFTGNTLIPSGSANCLQWPSTVSQAALGVCDSNTYDQRNTSSNVGTVRSASNITTYAALRAAWVGYANPNNDLNSVVL